MGNKDYPIIIKFIEALEREAKIYREIIKIKSNEDTFKIKDCLLWTTRIINDFRDKINK